MKLARLVQVDLRDQWKNEAYDFTPWLAEEENINLLGETVGLDLEVVGTEEKVGSFCADILCKDIATGGHVVIENQLEQTDHSHLGQVITYCAGLQATTFIWIASQIREEHRAAVDWLNSITGDNYNFFAIEVQLFKIENSAIAPNFKIVAKPNDWSRNVQSHVNNELNDTDKLKLEYWEAYKDYVLAQPQHPFNPHKPLPQSWTNVAIGTSAVHISVVIGRQRSKVAVQLILDSDNAKENYDKLYKSEYERSRTDIDEGIIWNRLDNNKMSIIEVTLDALYQNKNDWQRQFSWLYEMSIKFRDFFKPLVNSIK